MFTADWCGFCHRFLPHFKRVQGAWLVDISDEDDPLWDLLRIQVVPTVVLFEDGLPTRRWAGALVAEHVGMIQAALSGDPASPATRA